MGLIIGVHGLRGDLCNIHKSINNILLYKHFIIYYYHYKYKYIYIYIYVN